MGRIEEALRRRDAQGTLGGASATLVRPAEAFTSPWSFSDAPPPSQAEFVKDTLEPQTQGELTSFRGFNEAWLPKLVTATEPDTRLVEQFRRLAGLLHQSQVDHNTRVLMVTSADAGEGKSLTAINLALTLADSYGRRVLLVDADMRRPSLHDIVRVPNEIGLGETLKAAVAHKLPVYRISERLTLAPAGRPDRDPMTALTSTRMQELLAEASQRFDWVILDAPPVGPIMDANLLAPVTDGVLLVVRAARTRYDLVQRAVESIGRDRILGVVLNAADHARTAVYRDYYQAQGAGLDDGRDVP